MSIQQLKYIQSVVDFKNFQLAAEHCYVTQSTLSNMISKFENQIGITIFNRKTKPVSLTKEGAMLMQQIRVINHEVEVLKNISLEIKGEQHGVLKIGIIPTVAPYLIPVFLKEFANKHKGVKVYVKELTTDEIKKALELRTIDVGILALSIIEHQMQEIELYNEEFVVYDCREDEPSQKNISANQIDRKKLFLLEEGHCLRTQILDLCHIKKEQSFSNLYFESGSMESLINFTYSSKGMTVLPKLAINHLSEKQRSFIRHFSGVCPYRTIGAITHKNFAKKSLLNELVRLIRDRVNATLSGL